MNREWWASGVFDLDLAGILFDARRMKLAASEVRGLKRLARLPAGARVLDAACGTGRHSLEFARLGYRVTGVDVTATYVAEARRLARREKLAGATFERGELRDLYRFQGGFDLVVNLFTSFGYYRTDSDNFEALRQMASALRPGGSLIMDLSPRETIHSVFKPKDWQAVEGGYLMEKREWTSHGSRLRNEWILALRGRLREIHWDIRLYTVPELKALFKRAGLKDIRTYRDFSGRPWKLGERLVIKGVK
jgi:SAM-dependent methyltransferase